MKRNSSDSDRENRPVFIQQRESEPDSGPSMADSDPVEVLQEAGGNQAVKRLHENGNLRAKLEVSRSDDEHEREAERIADEVMREEDDPLDECPDIQRAATWSNSPSVSGQREQQIRALEGDGTPLPESERSFFEPKFGADFSDVRVHTSPEADAAARSINAKAFTHGKDMVFRSGTYNPGSRRSRKLIAHELVHVVQQGQAPTTEQVQRQESERTQDQSQGEGDGGAGEYTVAEGELVEDYIRWVIQNYYIYDDEVIKEDAPDPVHKDANPTDAYGEELSTEGVATAAGQELGKGAHYLAFVMGIGVSVMVGVTGLGMAYGGGLAYTSALGGVGGELGGGFSGGAWATQYARMTGRGIVHLSQLFGAEGVGEKLPSETADVNPAMATVVSPDDINVNLQGGEASQTQVKYLWYLIGHHEVTNKFLRDSDVDISNIRQDKFAELVNMLASKKFGSF